ncbi:MAG: hypothetical protein PHV19_04150, partial [Bacilli bacterium]|nr:hypothetical protein [Bacilli bacterium]
MNKKNKVLLASVGLAIFSGIAATSTTFAWFTTTQNASLSFNSATVETQDNNLNVAYKSSLNSGITNSQAGNVITLTGANKVTDISGDGSTFFKPLWNAALDMQSARVAYDIEQVGATDADGYYVDFTLTISRDSTGIGGMMVYLDNGTQIVAANDEDDADNKAVAGSRLAVLDEEDDVILVYAPDAEDNYYYVSEDAEGELYEVDGFVNTTELSGVVNSFTNYNDNDAAVAASAVAIADLTTETEVDVTFRAWLEGEDPDTINDAIGGVFNIDLKIYG